MIKVYSKADCPQCDQAKAILKKHGYSYEEVRIDEDDAARNFLIGAGHRSVPQMYVGDHLLFQGGLQELRGLTTKQIYLKISEINGY